MPSQFDNYPQNSVNELCISAQIILMSAHDTCSSFLDAFSDIRASRQARGAPTDEEQDLLRAMLTFSGSGLDSSVKQLIVDALPQVIEMNDGAYARFEEFFSGAIEKKGALDRSLITKVMISRDPREEAKQYLISTLCANSLQSKDQILRTASFFDIPSNELVTDFTLLDKIFFARNQIIHEMDVDFGARNRNRRSRSRNIMYEYANELFRIGHAFLYAVNNRLQ